MRGAGGGPTNYARPGGIRGSPTAWDGTPYPEHRATPQKEDTRTPLAKYSTEELKVELERRGSGK